MQFVGKALARRLESAEEMPQVDCARMFQQLRSEVGAAFEPFCGGHMIFAGLNSPIGHAGGWVSTVPSRHRIWTPRSLLPRARRASATRSVPAHRPELAGTSQRSPIHDRRAEQSALPRPGFQRARHCAVRGASPARQCRGSRPAFRPRVPQLLREGRRAGRIRRHAGARFSVFPELSPLSLRWTKFPWLRPPGVSSRSTVCLPCSGRARCPVPRPRHPNDAAGYPTEGCRRGGMRTGSRGHARRNHFRAQLRAAGFPHRLQQGDGHQALGPILITDFQGT
jgi:hypothetical protein